MSGTTLRLVDDVGRVSTTARNESEVTIMEGLVD